MDWDRLITVEQMEAATNELLETGKKVGADSWQQRVKNQTPHCGFGEAGTCCRICSMGPCRITPKAPRGICGCDVHGIVGRNYLRFTAGGAATHSDHGRQICHTLYQAKEGGSYQVKDPEKLKKIAVDAYKAVKCRGVTRVDFMVSPLGRCYVLELNTSPGFTSHSLVPKSGMRTGLSFAEVCDKILSLAATDQS